jgi:peroxiredoxin
MRFITPFLIAAPAAFAVMASPAAAAEIATGAKMPAAFAAKDAAGKPRSLASVAGKKGTVLVLFRSAKWCPYCQAQLKELKAAQADLGARGYNIVGLSYDAPETLAAFAQKTGINYALLSDEKSAMIDALGLRDPAYAAGSFAAGVPKSSTLIIDKAGVVRWKSVASDYKVRPQNSAILAAVDSLK